MVRSKNDTTIRVTVAIQSYKNDEMLAMCLHYLEQGFRDGFYDIAVADSATESATRLMMREDFPDVLFLPHTKNIGFGAMVNACITHTKTEYIFFINADTIVDAISVNQLRHFMDEHQSVGLCGPSQKNFNQKWENTRYRFYQPFTIFYRRTFLKKFAFVQRHLAHFEMRDIKKQSPYSVDWLIGSAMFVRRTAIEEIGMMDKRFFMYMEDVDWCRRFWINGWYVYYHPKVTIFHFYGKGSAQYGTLRGLLFNRLTWTHFVSWCKYFAKYFGQKNPHGIM